MNDEHSAGKSLSEMLGEFLREAAVLIFVFMWLERLADEGAAHRAGNLSLWAIVGVSGLFLSVGMAIERYRKT